MKNIILFGAGKNGILALEKYGRDKVAFFCDNDVQKQGTIIEGIKVIGMQELKELYKQGYKIVITPATHWMQVGQLEAEGISEYIIFENVREGNYLDDLKKAEVRFADSNSLLDEYALKVTDVGSLEDIESFKILVEEILQKRDKDNIPLTHLGVGDEGHFYGNLSNLIEYAGLTNDYDKIYAPVVSHQDCFPLYSVPFAFRTAMIFSGAYYTQKVHRIKPYMPTFTIGPYIHYAKGIYDAETIRDIKSKNGKTLLIYLPHAIENVKRGYSKEDFIDDVIKEYSDSFQTMILCVYWADLLEPVCDYAASKGLKIVSNGFRFDQRFNRRQKSLMEISDALVCGDIGTHIGFAIHMGLPIGRIGISDDRTINDIEFGKGFEKNLQFGKYYHLYKSEFNLFFDAKIRLDEQQKKWMNPLQGFDCIRNQEYIRDVLEICKDIWLESDGKLKYYPESVFKVLRRYEEDNALDKLSVLYSSLK